MKRALIIATVAVLAVGGSAVAYKAYARHDGWGYGRWNRMSTSDMSAYADARIAALKAGLTLSAEQEKLWPPVESTLKELAKKRIDRVQQFRAERQARRDLAERGDRAEPRDFGSPIERMRKGADRLNEGGADLKRLADATEPLYQSLDEAQKRRFNVLSHAGMRSMQRDGRGWHRRGEMGDEGRHFGQHDFGQRDEGNRDGWRRRIEFYGDTPGAERL
jgi:hypothetical protein